MRMLQWLVLTCLLPVIWLCAVFFSLFDAAQMLTLFECDRSGWNVYKGCLIAATVLAGIMLWTGKIRRLNTDQEIQKYCYVLLAAVLLAKLVWCGCLDSAQPNDMGRYWNYGSMLADGNRSELLADGMFTKDIFVRRSFFYTAVIFRCLGTGQIQLEVANVALQMGTLLFLLFWGKSAVGVRAIAVALPWFVVYPDWWFAPTLASHDIPGMFFISFALWSAEQVRKRINGVRYTEKWWRISFFTHLVLAGIGIAFLNVTRDYGPFALLSCFFAAAISLVLDDHRDEPPISGCPRRGILLPIISCLLVMFCAYSISHRILLRASEIPGIAHRGFDLLQLSSSVNSDTSGAFWNLAPWMFEYSPAVPLGDQKSTMLRKLLWEKIGKGLRLWSHIYQKKAVLAYSGRTMEYALCGDAGDQLSLSDINYLPAYQIMCGVIYGTLALVFALRLILIDRLPVEQGEAAVLILAFTFLLPLLLMTEAQNAYDQVFVIPMGTAAGVVAVCPINKIAHGVVRKARNRFLTAGLCLMLIFVAHLGFRNVVNANGMTFATVSDVVGDSGRVRSTETSVSLDFTDTQYVGPGELVLIEAKFKLTGKSLDDGIVCCFLSSDHEGLSHFYPVSWGTCSHRWELWMEGRQLTSGAVRDLSSPRFLQLRLPDAGRSSINCRILVKAHAPWDEKIVVPAWNNRPQHNRISIEYCF